MKTFKQFLFEGKVPDEYWDWFVREYINCEALLDSGRILDDFKKSGLKSEYEYYSKHKNNSDFNDLTGYIEHIRFEGDKLNGQDLYCYSYDMVGKPPFKYGKATHSFELGYHCKTLNEVQDWFPSECKELFMRDMMAFSFKGVHKVVKACETVRMEKCRRVPTGLLDIMRIPNLKKFKFTTEKLTEQKEINRINKISEIINRNLVDGDIFECQSELMDAGFTEQIK